MDARSINSTNVDTGDSVVSNLPFKTQLKSLLTTYGFLLGIPYVILYFAASYQTAAYLGPYGASWFGGCNTWKKQEKNSECLNDTDNYDYVTYNFNVSIFYTLMGVVSFLFSAYLGRLSDAYGRKPFFMLYCVTKMACYIPLIFTDNIWYYFALIPLAGLNGGMNSATPIMIAYMADIVPNNQRTLAFAIMYFLGGIGVLIGSICGVIITYIYGFYINWFVLVGLWSFILIGTLIFQYESLPLELRKPLIVDGQSCLSAYNPFKPLCRIHIHPIVLWIGILQLFISLPETGIVDMSNIIIDDLLGLTNVNKATMTNAAFNGVSASGLLFGNIIIVPILSKYTNNMGILIVGAIMLGLSFVSFGLIPFLNRYNMGYELAMIGGFLLTNAFIAFPAANSIVTKYLHESEQGEGVGIVYAVRSVTFIIAPLGFASLFRLGKYLHFKSLVFVVGIGFSILALITIIFPLRKAIEKIKKKREIRMYYSTYDLNRNLVLNTDNNNNNNNIVE